MPSVEFSAGVAVLIGLLAPLAALGLLVIIVVAIATSGRQRIKLYKPIDTGDRIDDWLYLPETLYAFMLIVIISARAWTNPSAQTLALCSLARTPNKPHRQI